LEDHGTELGTEEVHRSEKFLQLTGAIDQYFFVGDGLRDFNGEDEVFRSARGPVADGAGSGASVKGGVDFHRVEAVGVITEVVGRAQAFWIERTLPA